MDLMALKAVLSLDTSQYEDGLSRAGGLVGTLGGGLKTAMGVGAAAVGAATTAVIGLASASTSSYAEIEQLRGGVKKLFGDEDAKIVISNANKAFATAGMSAQQYMDQVTSFSAALVGSLGGNTAEAANRADVAMRAISDNFNTFGGDIQNVQNAFQGFAKQNYTMLDNLKLGYGGTKTEMERLIEDANKWAEENGKAAGLTIDSFADVVTAIDYIQQKQGIAGTTAAEAASTVSGSLGSVKAAWENLVAGFSDPEADLGQLMTNVVENAEVAFENLMPVFERALEGIGTFIEKMGPVLVEKLPKLVDTVLPSAIEAAISLTGSIAATLPSLAETLLGTLRDALITYGPTLLEAGVTLAATLPSLAETLLGTLRDALITYGPTLLEAGVTLVSNLASGVLQSAPNVVEAIKSAIDNAKQWIDTNLPEFLNRGVNAIVNMADGMWQAAPNVITNIGSIINSLLDALLAAVPSILQAGVQLILGLAQGLINNLPAVISAITQVLTQLLSTIAAHGPQILQSGAEAIAKLAAGLIQAIPNIVTSMGQITQTITNAVNDLAGKAVTWGLDMIKGFARGITNGIKYITDAVGSVTSKVSGMLHFSRPDEGPLRYYEQWMPDFMKGLAAGIENNTWRIEDAMSEVTDLMTVNPNSSFGVGSTFAPSVTVNVYATNEQNAEEVGQAAIDAVNAEIRSLRGAWGHA